MSAVVSRKPPAFFVIYYLADLRREIGIDWKADKGQYCFVQLGQSTADGSPKWNNV